MSDTTALVPVTPGPVTETVIAPVEDPRAVMEGIIAEHAAIPAEAREESAPIVPAAPAQQISAGDDQRDVSYAPEGFHYPAVELTQGFAQLMQANPQYAYDVGAVVLNQMPDLIQINSDYVLSVLGYDPIAAQKRLNDYARADYQVNR